MQRVLTVFSLSLADLWSEKIMTLCLVLAITAVVTPLLVLGSLKVGFVDRLKNDLIRDPTFRELRPSDATLKDDNLFQTMAASDAVSFSVPTVMMVPREVVFRKQKDRKRFEARLVPTGAGDPLLEHAKVSELGMDEVVISADIAKESSITVGDTIEILVFRTLRDRRERATTTLQIKGLFPPEYAGTPTIVAHAEMDRSVEFWRAGQPVPRLNWRGTDIDMKELYQQIHLAAMEPLSQFALDALETRLGVSEIKPMKWQEYLEESGLTELAEQFPGFGQKASHYRLLRSSKRFGVKDVDATSDIVDETRIIAHGIAPPQELKTGSKASILYFADFRLLDGFCQPDCLNARNYASSLKKIPVFKPENVNLDELKLEKFAQAISFESRIRPFLTDEGKVYADWRLGGILNRAANTTNEFDPNESRFYEIGGGYRGFRAVASDIDAVVAAAELIKSAGYSVSSSESAVRRLQKLDQGLNILVSVVAGVALIGGFVVLGINFFASVQRKRMSFAVLRLLGTRKSFVFLHPFIQSITVVLVGFLFSVVAYFLVGYYVNQSIAEGLGFGGTLSVLRFSHFAGAFFIVLIGSMFACIISAVHAMRVDASIALKDVGT